MTTSSNDTIDARLEGMGSALRGSPRATPPPIGDLPPYRGRGPSRAAMVSVGVVMLLVVSGIFAATRQGGDAALEVGSAPTDAPSEPVGEAAAPLRARIEVSATTFAVGTVVAGSVVVNNDTGGPIVVTSCMALFHATLLSDTLDVGFFGADDCGQAFTIPEGESRWPFAVAPTFTRCSTDELGDAARDPSTPACLPDGGSPPLPAGRYTLVVSTGPSTPDLPALDPIAITFT